MTKIVLLLIIKKMERDVKKDLTWRNPLRRQSFVLDVVPSNKKKKNQNRKKKKKKKEEEEEDEEEEEEEEDEDEEEGEKKKKKKENYHPMYCAYHQCL